MSFIKNSGQELQHQTKDIKSQLADQIKCLEQRTETQNSILHEINDFIKKRAELDLEYSKQLEKLTKSVMIKHKNEKQKRANWPFFSTCSLWQQLVDDTKEEAKQRGITAEIFGNQSREIGIQAQGELIRVLTELQAAMKAYQMCYADFNVVKEKLRNAELSKQKSEDSNSLRKQKSMQKALDKRLTKYEAARLKCNRARNEYLLCVEAANSAIHKFYAHDLSELIDCTDLGFDFWVNMVLTNIIAARKAVCQQEMNSLASLSSFRESFHLDADKHKFFESNSSVFMLPKPFEFKRDTTENCSHVVVAGSLADDLKVRQHQINRRLETLKKESDDILGELDKQEEHLRFLLSAATIVEITPEGVVDNRPPNEVSENAIEEASIAYADKFRHHLLNGNLIRRLEARAYSIGSALKSDGLGIAPESPSTPMSPGPQSPQVPDDWHQRLRRKKRTGSSINPSSQNPFQNKRPKLFGGSLDEYLDATGEQIPLIVISCIRVLSRFALHHQGLFRIPGSVFEMNNMKEAFESGDDPLANVITASDINYINSIAGVLKLYLRELREPLFPVYLFEQLTECSKAPDFVSKITPLLNKLPLRNYLLLRYLFAFLNDLSHYSDENMMDTSNLAICFGPTLLPIPDDKDQVYYQTSVNELIRNLIIKYDQCFSSIIPGPVYRVYDDEIAYGDDGEECFTMTSGPDYSTKHNFKHNNFNDSQLMTTSLHGFNEHNGLPGRDRRIAKDAAAIAQHRLSLYSGSNGVTSPTVTSYEEGDERNVLSIRNVPSPGYNPSLITPISADSVGRTSLSGESTVSSHGQKENGTVTTKSKTGNIVKNVNVLQERSSIDSGIGAPSTSNSHSVVQQKSPAPSSASSCHSKQSTQQKSDRIRVVPKVKAMPLTTQMNFQENEEQKQGVVASDSLTGRIMNSGKTTPISSASSSSSPRILSAFSGGSISEDHTPPDAYYTEIKPKTQQV